MQTVRTTIRIRKDLLDQSRLLALLYLVQIKQIFKSKASYNISGSLDMNNQTQEMVKDESKNNGVPTYTISGDKVMIKLKDGTVENINNSLQNQEPSPEPQI